MNVKGPELNTVDVRRALPRARLRILETTDLHMQLLAYDYFGDHADAHTGLIHLADQIETLRSGPDDTALLFDNGDFIQGNPLADYIATNGTGGQTHPMVAALNTLAYDAVALGNHEFNYGLPFLENALKDACFPIICANIAQRHGAPIAQPFVILERDLPCDDGMTRRLKIGVTGFVPPQITIWDQSILDGALETDDIIASAQKVIPLIKAAGADIIVALCHSGIGATDHIVYMENAAVPLAAVAGIDVILSGHTHEVFPGDSRSPCHAVDPDRGTLHGKPAVMAGFYGNYLGIIDLQLAHDSDGWQVMAHSVRLQEGAAMDTRSPLQQTLTDQVQAAHLATLAHIRQPIARTEVAIHSYFATIAPDLTQQLLAQAQQNGIAAAMADTAHHDLPILSATAPFRFGGRAGPGHFIDIPPGTVALRDAAAIYPFANKLCAIRRSGSDIRNWLERAASHFRQITPGRHDQPLIDQHHPAYNCDTLFGLTYEFDLTQPARFGPDGSIHNPDASRLRNLCYQGKPVACDDAFIVATNGYRTNGGGGFQGVPKIDILYTSVETTRDVLVAYLRALDTVAQPATPTWQFTPIPNTGAVFQSAPAAKHHLPHGITHVGPDTDGFDCYLITF